MRRVVIADTSFLIAIQKLQLFNQVRDLYKEVYITRKIAEEFQLTIPEWIIVQEPVNFQVQSVLSSIWDEGEASAIALAYDYHEVILVIDDLKWRKEAIKLGFKITGTLGVLYKLQQENLITALNDKILQLSEFGFRINPRIIQEILRKAGEI